MPDYSKGKIYKLWSLDNLDMVYIGSTCQPLHKRLYGHKKDWGRWKRTGEKYYSSYDMFENCQGVKIELVIECPCDNKNQLLRTEGKYIREIDCINKLIPGRTKREHYQDHKQAIAQRTKQYRETNRDKIKARRSIKTKCECGAVVCKDGIAKHRRTKKHERLMNQQ